MSDNQAKFIHEEPITTHQLPKSEVSQSDYCFSNGKKYMCTGDRILCDKDYYNGFSERDKFLDDAITRGNDLHCNTDLWRVYDDAVLNYGLKPIDPYEWLFKHATLNDKSIIISIPHKRILLIRAWISAEYYDFIHGRLKSFARYARPIE